MALDDKGAEEKAKELLTFRDMEKTRLDRIHRYLRGTYRFLWLSKGIPTEVRRLAEISRVNVMRFIVNSPVQSMFVDGYRSKEGADQPGWELWQANRMDARQIGIHRATVAYGAGYVVVLPGDPVPVVRGVSPRRMTAVYGDDDDWPEFALERRRSVRAASGQPKEMVYRLYDEEAVYHLTGEEGSEKLSLKTTEKHDAGRTPVVRLLSDEDLDEEVIGEVEPHIPLQDQINLTTFGLLVAQHYGAFRQRYVIGWLAKSEEEALKTSASKLWTFEDDSKEIKVGEFDQTDLTGYLESRESTARLLASLSQTPVHEMLGQMANLSAEALVAARDSTRRFIAEKKTLLGERHEQWLALGAELMGKPSDPSSWVHWRDMEPRAPAELADALGKFVTMLGIPQEELWDRVAESQQEVERWKTTAKREGAAVEKEPPKKVEPGSAG